MLYINPSELTAAIELSATDTAVSLRTKLNAQFAASWTSVDSVYSTNVDPSEPHNDSMVIAYRQYSGPLKFSPQLTPGGTIFVKFYVERMRTPTYIDVYINEITTTPNVLVPIPDAVTHLDFT